MPSPHTPIAPHEAFRGRTGISEYADFLVQTDAVVGQLMRALDETQQADKTLVLFTCDNGTSPKAEFEELEDAGVHLREHWRGWKADAYEGGHRVPFIVRWPGKVEPGTRRQDTITLTDVMATCADVLGYDLPPSAAEDSVSLMPILRGKAAAEPLHEIVIHHSSAGHFAVRKGRWKLLLCRGSGGWSPPREAEAKEQGLPLLQLYDLTSDPKETRNLHEEHPEKVRELVDDLAHAFRQGRTTPGPRQANEGWPNTIGAELLSRFPQLAEPGK
jgi:arylsulfatase A-like enzyme